MNTQTQPAVECRLDGMVRQHTNAALAHGWYWVRYERSNCDLTDPQPALWDGHQWRSVGWSGQPLHGALVLEPCMSPGCDPLQGAADWLCKAIDDPGPSVIQRQLLIGYIQRQLLIGYNRAARLFAQAMACAA